MLPGRAAWAVPSQLRRLSQRAASTAAGGSSAVQTACLEDARCVIRLAGSGLVPFLQGIVTNDVLAMEAPGAPPMYSCILSAQGRHLHDLFLHRTQDAEPTVLLDADRQGKEDLLRLLKRYRLRQKIDIQDVSGQYQVWARFGGSNSSSDGTEAAAAAAATAAVGQAGAGWAADPRLSQLGLRAVLPAGDSGGGSSASGGGSTSGWREHRRWRIMHGVAEGDSEIPTGEVVPLEFNIDGLHGISFTKGCYVGQELMARTHFKGVVRKRLIPFALAGSTAAAAAASSSGSGAAVAAAAAAAAGAGSAQAPAAAAEVLQPGTEVYVLQPGGKHKSVGVVRVADGDVGLAVLRMAAVEAAAAAGQPLLVGEGAVAVEVAPWRPDWWPESWGREEGAQT